MVILFNLGEVKIFLLPGAHTRVFSIQEGCKRLSARCMTPTKFPSALSTSIRLERSHHISSLLARSLCS